MPTERELYQDLFQACRSLLRYDGIDSKRVRQAVDDIREIVGEWIYLQEHEELDDE